MRGRAMKEYRVLDHNINNGFFYRFEIQERSRFCGIWGWWTHLTGFKTQEEAIEHVQKLEDMYSQKLPIELYRTRVK